MENQLLHTPEGVRDIYNGECERKLEILARMNQEIRKYGYHPIQTPTFEFFDIFSKEVGTTPSRDLYKFFDREGNTLVLRPDMTPPVARAAAKYFTGEMAAPIRLCYEGNVFINNHSYQGRMKESTQLGCEYIGVNSVDADSEIIAIVVDALRASGLSDFQISVSHVAIVRGLMEACGFSPEEEEHLSHLIANKNFYGVEEFLDQKDLPNDLRNLFNLLKNMYASPEQWKDMKEDAEEYPAIYEALRHLELLHEQLQVYGVDGYVSYEPGVLSNYRYYTGIIFAGYTFGSGEPIVKGGRYDSLLSYFGKNAPAIGFALMADQLLLALERQKIEVFHPKKEEVILYGSDCTGKAIRTARSMRDEGKNVSLAVLPEDEAERERLLEAFENANITVLE